MAGRCRPKWRNPHIHDFVAELFRPYVPSGTILDIPAGDGVNSRRLIEAGYSARGADLFPEHCHGGPCDRIDMTKPLPYPDASFDGVLHSEGIEHVDNQVAVLAELARVLRPGGVLVVTTPNLLHFEGRLNFLLSGHMSTRRAMVVHSRGYWAPRDEGAEAPYFGHVFLINYFQLRFYLMHVGLEVVGVARSRYSLRSILLAPFLWLPVVFSTYRLVFHEKFGAPREIRSQLLREVLSPEVLLSRKLIVVARKPEREAAEGLAAVH